MKNKLNVISIVIMSFLASCSVNMNQKNDIASIQKSSSQINVNSQIIGRIEFPQNFKIKASYTDIVDQATVSIILPQNVANANSTIAVGLTDANGNFKINPDGNSKLLIGNLYVLEARKRLGGEGTPLLSLKTFVKWTANGWVSITKGNIAYINTKTTSLAIMSGYNSTLLNPNETIGKLDIVDGSTVATDINANVDAQKILDVESLVTLSLESNEDPAQRIVYDNYQLTYQYLGVLYIDPSFK